MISSLLSYLLLCSLLASSLTSYLVSALTASLFQQWFIFPVGDAGSEDEAFTAQIKVGSKEESKCLTIGPLSDDGSRTKLWLWDCILGLADQVQLLSLPIIFS